MDRFDINLWLWPNSFSENMDSKPLVANGCEISGTRLTVNKHHRPQFERFLKDFFDEPCKYSCTLKFSYSSVKAWFLKLYHLKDDYTLFSRGSRNVRAGRATDTKCKPRCTTFRGHLFYTYFLQGGGGTSILAPLYPLLIIQFFY